MRSGCRLHWTTIVAAAGIGSAACSVPGTDDPGALVRSTDGGTADLPLDAGGALPTIDVPPRLSLSAFDGTAVLSSLSLDVEAVGNAAVGKIHLRNSGGTIDVDGRPLSTVAFQSFAWPAYHLDLYEAIALAPDRIYVFWLYCERGFVTFFLMEHTRGNSILGDHVQGSCVNAGTGSSPTLHAPPVDMEWPAPVGGVEVSGPTLRLPSGRPGTVVYDGALQAAFPFVRIDCLKCESVGAYELHALLWNPNTRAITIGIFYLRPALPESVSFQYALTLPRMKRTLWSFFDASWAVTSP